MSASPLPRPHGDDTPEITVVIPTHNRCEILPRTLHGALAQEGVRCEVIVVVDGAGDGTSRYLRGLDDPRLRIVERDPARGVASARNAGIAQARAPWLAFLDDDDLWSPRKLRTQLDLAGRTGADAVYCGAVRFDGDGRVVHQIEMPAAERLRAELFAHNALPSGPSNVIARTALVRRLGGFDRDLSFLADWDMWLRLAAAGRFAMTPEILVGYLDHGGSMSSSRLVDPAREFRRLVAKHTGADPNERFDLPRFTRWRAHRQRRAGHTLTAAALLVRAGVAGRRPRDVAHGFLLLAGRPAYAWIEGRRRAPGGPGPQAAEFPWLRDGPAARSPVQSSSGSPAREA